MVFKDHARVTTGFKQTVKSQSFHKSQQTIYNFIHFFTNETNTILINYLPMYQSFPNNE